MVDGKFLGELEYLGPSGGRAGEPIIAGKRSHVLLPLMVVLLWLETAEPRVPKELSAEDWCLRPGNGFGRSPDMERVYKLGSVINYKQHYQKNLTFPRFRPVHPDVALGALVGSIPSFSFAETWD